MRIVLQSVVMIVAWVTFRPAWPSQLAAAALATLTALLLEVSVIWSIGAEPGLIWRTEPLVFGTLLMFTGIAVAGRMVVGARRGLMYLRGEYRYLQEHLQAVLERRRTQHLLGESIQGHAGFDFDIDIHIGAGAYVCGEESALIESLEGKRGTPRIRPPFPVESGYLGQPTTVKRNRPGPKWRGEEARPPLFSSDLPQGG